MRINHCPVLHQLSQTMKEFSNTIYLKSEQNKDSTKARISRDNGDMKALAKF